MLISVKDKVKEDIQHENYKDNVYIIYSDFLI